MSNVVSISCTCDYLVKRAARHRRTGRYDEAMALLWKARNEFGGSEEVLSEMALVYDEIGCEEDAFRAYLRLFRLGGKHQAKALFHLTVSCAQHGDMERAVSYYEHLFRLRMNANASEGVSDEMMDALDMQIHQEIRKSCSLNKRNRARMLEKHAASCLQAGRAAAAQRAMEHSLRFRATARGYTMLACCQLIRMQFEDAVVSAETAHTLAPGNVQTLCVLADSYMAFGQLEKARKAIYLAALRAYQVDDLLSVAVESAKAGEDALTLQITRRILKIAPYHTRAMMIRACAYINRHAYKEAKRLLGRLRGLQPENTVCESYYRSISKGDSFFERLTLGLDVTREEGINRASELVSMLYMDPKAIDDDKNLCLRICRLCDWAFHSPMAGGATKTIALVLLSSLQSDEAREILLDLLIDPQISDSLKLNALQLLTARDGFHPYDVDMGGKLVRLAAGGVTAMPVGAKQANSKIVQRVFDTLASQYPHASEALLNAFLAYLKAYGYPEGRREEVCAAALEYWYLIYSGSTVHPECIARRYGVSVRMMHTYIRRFESCMQEIEQSQQEE